MIRLGGGQRGRRLVERQQVAIERERARDLEQLAMGDRQRIDGRIGRDRQLKPRQQLARPDAHLGFAEPSEAAGDFAAGEDVRGLSLIHI